jgi:Domain of unknown function (DUF4384)
MSMQKVARRALVLLIAWLCLWSGAGAHEQAPAELRVLAKTPEAARIAVDASTLLHSGDALWLEIRPIRKSYLRVLHVAPGGTATFLYAAAPSQLHEGQLFRLPAQKHQFFTMDDETGEETIAMFASQAPLESISEAYADLVRSVDEQRKLPPGSPLLQRNASSSRDSSRPRSMQGSRAAARRMPGILDLAGPTRGLSDGASPILAATDPSGVAVALLRFQHAR